jgi:hypothetical protein
MYARKTTMIGGMVAVLALLSFDGAALRAGVFFHDDFDSGMSPEWVCVRPAEWVEGITGNGWLHTKNQGGPFRDSYAFVHIGDTNWTDYDFYAEVEPIPLPLPAANGLICQCAELYFRASEITGVPAYGWEGGVGGYCYLIFLAGPQNQMSIGRHEGFEGFVGSGVVLGRFPAPSSQWPNEQLLVVPGHVVDGPMEVLVKVRDATIQLFINGGEVFTFTDPDPLPYGGIGLGAPWETEARFDDVWVTPEPATLTLLGVGGLGLALLGRRRA